MDRLTLFVCERNKYRKIKLANRKLPKNHNKTVTFDLLKIVSINSENSFFSKSISSAAISLLERSVDVFSGSVEVSVEVFAGSVEVSVEVFAGSVEVFSDSTGLL